MQCVSNFKPKHTQSVLWMWEQEETNEMQKSMACVWLREQMRIQWMSHVNRRRDDQKVVDEK